MITYELPYRQNNSSCIEYIYIGAVFKHTGNMVDPILMDTSVFSNCERYNRLYLDRKKRKSLTKRFSENIGKGMGLDINWYQKPEVTEYLTFAPVRGANAGFIFLGGMVEEDVLIDPMSALDTIYYKRKDKKLYTYPFVQMICERKGMGMKDAF